MRTKNPLESQEVEELHQIGLYWMDKCHQLYFEKKTMEAFLKAHGIDPPLTEFFAKMNTIQAEETKRWEETQDAIKTMQEIAYDEKT